MFFGVLGRLDVGCCPADTRLVASPLSRGRLSRRCPKNQNPTKTKTPYLCACVCFCFCFCFCFFTIAFLEVTMGILAKSSREKNGGFVQEFCDRVWAPLGETLLANKCTRKSFVWFLSSFFVLGQKL